MRRARSAEAATRMRCKTRGDGEAEGGAVAAESGASSDRRSLRDGLGMERREDAPAPAAGTRAVEVEAAAVSELCAFTQDAHMRIDAARLCGLRREARRGRERHCYYYFASLAFSFVSSRAARTGEWVL